MVDNMNSFWQFESICHNNGITPQESIELLERVLRTKSAIASGNAQPSEVYDVMLSVSSDLPRFKGDAKLFSQIYNSVEATDNRALLFFLTKINQYDRWRLCVPDVLIEKFGEHINESTETVFVPECENYGLGLLNLIEANPTVKFTLSTRYDSWLRILTTVYTSCSNAEVVLADIYTDGFTNSRYDLILAVPVFGARSIAEGQDFICKDSDMIAVQNLLYHINMDGQLVIVLPAKITFGSGSIASLREYIETNYSIDEISVLPAGLFAPATAIKTFMFAFSNGSTEEVMIRKYEAGKPIKRNAGCSELVLAGEEMLFQDEFADLNGWNVEMAFGNDDSDIRDYNRSSTKKILLKDVATLFRGKAVNDKTDGGNIGVINISNITDSGIDYAGLEMLDEEEHKVARYALEEGDVLVTARGTTVKVAVFERQAMTCIPSANFNVIRPEARMRGAYLKLFLESPVGTKLLKSLQRGTTVMNINYKDLGELEVPLLPLEEQDQIISDYKEGLSLYKQTIAAAEEAWSGVKEEIQSRLF